MAHTPNDLSGRPDTDPRGPAPRETFISPNLTLVFGLVFLAVGIVGFFITGFDQFFDHHTGERLLWFEINPAHNLVHLLFGVLGLTLARTPRTAMTFGLVVGIGYIGALLYGLVANGETWDFLSINTADNWLHLVLAVAGFGLTAVAAGEVARTTGGDAVVPDRADRGAGTGGTGGVR